MLPVSKGTTQFCLIIPQSPCSVRLSYRTQEQWESFWCQTTLILHKEKTVGMYRELRKKQIQLQKDASNLPLPPSPLYLFFLKHCSCRKAHAFRSGTSADITFCISSSACNLAHKVSKSHFAKSSNNKMVCSSQQVSKRNHLGHTKLIFTLSLTCSHL